MDLANLAVGSGEPSQVMWISRGRWLAGDSGRAADTAAWNLEWGSDEVLS